MSSEAFFRLAQSGALKHVRVPTMVLALVVGAQSGCVWPGLVAKDGALFQKGVSVAGAAGTDSALCTLATAGPDATRMLSKPEGTPGGSTFREVCDRSGTRSANLQRPGEWTGMVGELIHQPLGDGIVGESRHASGYLFRVRNARGIAILFPGLAMPADGWITQRFAAAAAGHGYATFALIRDETRSQVVFDPVLEAHRGRLAAGALLGICDVAANARVAFVGYSLGGMEALLAARDAADVDRRQAGARAVVLDPVLDPARVARHLDKGTPHLRSLSVDTMQAFFRRILRDRYGEQTLSFDGLLSRTDASGAMTNPKVDAPATWICERDIDATIFLSTTDPVLGNRQRTVLRCVRPGVKKRSAFVPGHIPFACNLTLFSEMAAAMALPSASTSGATPTF